MPGDRAALEALPGVGRKTANVVLNVAFGESTMAVDTHIFRLGNRTGLAPGKDPARGGGRAAEAHPQRAAAGRTPLADPARALRVQGPAAGVLALRGRAMVPLRRIRWPRRRWLVVLSAISPRSVGRNSTRGGECRPSRRRRRRSSATGP